MHLGHADREKRGEIPQEPAPGLVQQSRGSDPRQRVRGDVQPEAAAAGVPGATGRGLLACLSLPRASGDDADEADRNRAVQGRRLQPKRLGEAGQEPRLLEIGSSVSGRHRIYGDQESLDRDPGLHRRRVRPDVPGRSLRPAAQGHQGAGAALDLRTATDQRQHESHHQSRGEAVQQSRTHSRRDAGDRP